MSSMVAGHAQSTTGRPLLALHSFHVPTVSFMTFFPSIHCAIAKRMLAPRLQVRIAFSDRGEARERQKRRCPLLKYIHVVVFVPPLRRFLFYIF